MKNQISIFRAVSTLEAVSFLIMLFIGMPLKYGFDNPTWIEILGPIHGGLFILYVIGAVFIAGKLNWTRKMLWIAILCSVLPFGPFYVERKYLPKTN